MNLIFVLSLIVTSSLYSMQLVNLVPTNEKEFKINQLLSSAFYGLNRTAFDEALKMGLDVHTSYNDLDTTPLGEAVLSYCAFQYNRKQQELLLSMIEELLKRGANPNLCILVPDEQKGEVICADIGDMRYNTPIYFKFTSSTILTIIIYCTNVASDLVELLLRHGLNKEDDMIILLLKRDIPNLLIDKSKISNTFFMDKIKTWYLLFPDEVQKVFKDSKNSNAQRFLDDCKEEVESAPLVRKKRKLIDSCGGMLPYLMAQQIGDSEVFEYEARRKRARQKMVEQKNDDCKDSQLECLKDLPKTLPLSFQGVLLKPQKK